MAPAHPDIVAVGDIHGRLRGLLEVLKHAKIIGSRSKPAWTGGRTVLVQTGDVIDRGPHGVEAYALFEALQPQAAAAGGRVVRLIGNHELQLLRGDLGLTDLKDPYRFQQRLQEDVLAGKVQGAYAGQGFLFTHAGVRGRILRSLLPRSAPARKDVTASLAREIDGVLVGAVRRNRFLHPIFRWGVSRGGHHRVGGVFWEDASEVFGSFGALEIKQVFGHTPEEGIVTHPSGRLVKIDAGIGHGGGLHYLRVRDGRLMPQEVPQPQKPL